jgi:hypothetical protein
MTKPAAYPDALFVAHRLFKGYGFPAEGSWGDLLDGPMTDEEEVIDKIMDSFADDEFGPDRSDLRVWQIVAGKPAEDCTAWALRTIAEVLEDQYAR